MLHRPHFAFTFSDVDDFINYFCSVGVKHRIPYRWRPQLPDEADEHDSGVGDCGGLRSHSNL